jgi:hypothetical protein
MFDFGQAEQFKPCFTQYNKTEAAAAAASSSISIIDNYKTFVCIYFKHKSIIKKISE